MSTPAVDRRSRDRGGDRWRPDPRRGYDALPQDAKLPRWARAPGVRLHGTVQSSGLREPTFLAERADGRMVQLSALLYLILEHCDAGLRSRTVAKRVSSDTGRRLTAAALDEVARTKLAPVGLVYDATAGTPAAPTAPRGAAGGRGGSALQLHLHATLIPARVVRVLAGPLRPAFRAPVVLLALLGMVVTDVALWRHGDGLAALDQVLATPAFLLVLFALLTGSAIVHELGHATACSYGGARPGRVGVGVYLLFPAFFTDVTDSYRLDRRGRLRTDLGGLYFNVWCVLALGAGYLASGQGVLLLAALLLHVEMAQQLLPTVRFDGYFVLADLAGVPDLFSRLGPTLRSLVPGRPTDPRVEALRPRARRIITGWVLVTVPTLAAGVVYLAWSLPTIVTRAWSAVLLHAEALARAWASGDVVGVLLAAIGVVLLAVPLLGLAALAPQLVWLLIRLAHRVARGLARCTLRRNPKKDPAGRKTELR